MKEQSCRVMKEGGRVGRVMEGGGTDRQGHGGWRRKAAGSWHCCRVMGGKEQSGRVMEEGGRRSNTQF